MWFKYQTANQSLFSKELNEGKEEKAGGENLGIHIERFLSNHTHYKSFKAPNAH